MKLWERSPSGLLVPHVPHEPQQPEPPDPTHGPLGTRVTVYVHDAVGGGIEYGGLLARELSLWDWTEGNWSCDCNRASLFPGGAAPDTGYCMGCKRYVVVDVVPMPDGYTLDDFNPGYPDELKQLARQMQAEGFEVKT